MGLLSVPVGRSPKLGMFYEQHIREGVVVGAQALAVADADVAVLFGGDVGQFLDRLALLVSDLGNGIGHYAGLAKSVLISKMATSPAGLMKRENSVQELKRIRAVAAFPDSACADDTERPPDSRE